jgi:hypothetical protein
MKDPNQQSGSSPGTERHRFDRAVAELRAEHRIRPSYDVGVTASSGACYSVRQRTAKPTDEKCPEPFETRSETFDGPVIPIWHQPDHLVFDKKPGESQKQLVARASEKPRYMDEHVVMLGDKSVPASDIYSQGENRVAVHGEEVRVTDFWVVEYNSGWRGFVDPRIHLSAGDRERDEFFEPPEQQMSLWLRKYTNGREFKKTVHSRFRRTKHNWLFKNHTDEAPAISQSFHPKELEYDFNDVYEDGAYIALETGQPEDAEQAGQVTKPKPGQPWCDDPTFVDDLNQMLPKGYARLRVYRSGYSVPLPDDVRLAPPRDLDRSTYLAVPNPEVSCSTYLVSKTELRPLRSSALCLDPRDQGLVESKSWMCMLGKLEPTTREDQETWETILRESADYDPAQHKRLCHFYEYGYKYYPGELTLGDGVFQTVKNTTITKETRDPLKTIVVTWDDAIRNTFGHVTAPPQSGFYMLYKMTPNTPTRVYPVFTGTIIYDGFEDPVPFGTDDIHQEIRESVRRIKSKMQSTTIRRNLRNIVLYGDRSVVTHIGFGWTEGKLTWKLGNTHPATVSTVDS